MDPASRSGLVLKLNTDAMRQGDLRAGDRGVDEAPQMLADATALTNVDRPPMMGRLPMCCPRIIERMAVHILTLEVIKAMLKRPLILYGRNRDLPARLPAIGSTMSASGEASIGRHRQTERHGPDTLLPGFQPCQTGAKMQLLPVGNLRFRFERVASAPLLGKPLRGHLACVLVRVGVGSARAWQRRIQFNDDGAEARKADGCHPCSADHQRACA